MSISPLSMNAQLAATTPLKSDTTSKSTNVNTERIERKRSEAQQVAQDFETMFVDLMIKSMRQTAQPEDTSNAEDVYQGMLDSEYSKSMTASKSFGIREQILNWLEQTDPELRKNPAVQAGAKETDQKLQGQEFSAANLMNESMALKAATQAYRFASTPR